MTSQRSVVFAEPVRTAIGTFGGSKDVTAPTLGSVAIGAAVADGRIRYREDITDRLENAPTAFIDMLQGRNFGKALCASHPQRDIFDFDRLNAAATAHRFDTSGAATAGPTMPLPICDERYAIRVLFRHNEHHNDLRSFSAGQNARSKG